MVHRRYSLMPMSNVQDSLKVINIIPLKQYVIKYRELLRQNGLIIIEFDNISSNDIVISVANKVSDDMPVKIYSLHDINRIYVPDMAPIEFAFYRGNLFKVICNLSQTFNVDFESELVIRSYYYRSKTISNLCIKLDEMDKLLPYNQSIMNSRGYYRYNTPKYL